VLVGVLLIAASVATAALAAASLRLGSLVSTLLVSYLALVADVGLTTLVLSPFRAVDRPGLAIAQAVLLAGAAGAWWWRGRPGLPLAAARAAVREGLSDPATALFFAFLLVLLAYELVLALGVPPNNTDVLAYHLPKAAAWAQHGGYYWIPNAPTLRMNEFQPLAGQEVLYLLVATGGSGALVQVPQFVAELAILVAVYGAARRVGFAVRPSACAAFLLATFSLVALEASTAQNDLMMASFPAVAACLLLGPGLLEPGLAGAAAGVGLGAKLTVALVLPILLWLALTRGRRVLLVALLGGIAGFVAIGMWGYVLNAVHTGHVLGQGSGPEEDRAPPSYPGSVKNGLYLLYGLMDLSVLSRRLVSALAVAGVVLGVAGAWWTLRRRGRWQAVGVGLGIAVACLAPLIVIGGEGLIAFLGRWWGIPVRGPGGDLYYLDQDLNAVYAHISNDSYSGFGPVAVPALLLAAGLTLWDVFRRGADPRRLAFVAAMPLFFLILSAETIWGPWLIRFFLAPIALAAPALAVIFRNRLVSAAFLAVAAIAVTLTVVEVQTKPLSGKYGYGPPWTLTQDQALWTNSRGDYANALLAYDQVVPPKACVGAVLDEQEPSWLLFVPHLSHRIFYLSSENPVTDALQRGLFYVVVSTGTNAPVADVFKSAGWRIQPLGTYWQLATAPHAGDGACESA
jgi:hypothetical protein